MTNNGGNETHIYDPIIKQLVDAIPEGAVVYYVLHFAWQYLVNVAWGRFIPITISFNYILLDTVFFPAVLSYLDLNAHVSDQWRTWTPILSIVGFVLIARFYQRQRDETRCKAILIHVISMILSALCFTILDNMVLLFILPEQIPTAWYLDVMGYGLLIFALFIQENRLRFEEWITCLIIYVITHLMLYIGHMYCQKSQGCYYFYFAHSIQWVQIILLLIAPVLHKCVSRKCGKCGWISPEYHAVRTQFSSRDTDISMDGYLNENEHGVQPRQPRFSIGDIDSRGDAKIPTHDELLIDLEEELEKETQVETETDAEHEHEHEHTRSMIHTTRVDTNPARDKTAIHTDQDGI